MNIPLSRPDLGEAEEQAVLDVLRSGMLAMGAKTQAFEEAWAEYCGVRHAVFMANGTVAQEAVLRALGIGEGDEVVTVSFTFNATASVILQVGAKPVFVDIREEDFGIDPDLVEAAITPRTKAIMPVHLFGQMADVDALTGLGPTIVEDAAQSQGARRHGTQTRFGGTSFYPGKNLGAYGDAGAVVCDDDDLARTVRNLRNYGSDVKYHHPEIGFNSRLDSLQAVVLSAKLKRLARWNEQRRAAAARYDELLAGEERVTLPVTAPGNEHVWHLYVIRVDDRDGVLSRLHEAGVGAGIHYPVPVHLQGAFKHLGHGPGAFPVTEALADSILSLPLYPQITGEQQQFVVETLRAAL